MHQMNMQHQYDLQRKEDKEENDRVKMIKVAKTRLRDINDSNGTWETDGFITLTSLTQTNLKRLLNIFQVKGRAEFKKKTIAKAKISDKVIAILGELNITQSSFSNLKSSLIEEIENLGNEYNEEETKNPRR